MSADGASAPTTTTTIWGAPEGYDALLLARRQVQFGGEHDGPLLHGARDDTNLARLADLLAFVRPEAEILRFPAWDCLPYDRVSPNSEIVGQRIAALAKLRGVVRPDGTVTAGNASGVNDGACALIVASEAAAAAHGLRPLARIVGAATAGVAPRIMGMGPVPAARKALARCQLTLADFDVVELNEAFAAQGLAVLRELGLPDDAEHVNPNGGAIALGHPLGARGARLVTPATYQLERTGGRYALCTMCSGVGQGIALVIERSS